MIEIHIPLGKGDSDAFLIKPQLDLFDQLAFCNSEFLVVHPASAPQRHKQLYASELDEKLVYIQGLHKRLKKYTKNIPPHVRAARMLDHFEGRIVHYVITKAGPEPIQKRTVM